MEEIKDPRIIYDPEKIDCKGLFKSPDDPRDFRYEAMGVFKTDNLPSKYKTDNLPIRNQGIVGSCVGFATSAIQEADEMCKGKREYLSPLFIYAKSKEIDGTKDEGTFIRCAMKILKDYGVALEGVYPYKNNEDSVNLKFPSINKTCMKDASKRKVKAYASLNSLQQVKKAIFHENGVVAGVTVTDNFKYPQNGCTGGLGGFYRGNHAIALVGWDDEKELSYKYYEGGKAVIEKYKGCIIFKNSWDTDYGDKGYGYIPYEKFDIAEPDEMPYKMKYIQECWTTVHDVLAEDINDPKYHQKFNGLIPVEPEPEKPTDPTEPEKPDEPQNPHIPTKNEKEKIIKVEMSVKDKIVKINGTVSYLSVLPKVINGVTLVPLRFISEVFGAVVGWNGTEKEIRVYSNLDMMLNTLKEKGIEIDSLVSTYPVNRNKKIDVYMNIKNSYAKINDNLKPLVHYPIISDGATLIPLRFISEIFGCNVSYSNSQIVITLTTNAVRTQFNNIGID